MTPTTTTTARRIRTNWPARCRSLWIGQLSEKAAETGRISSRPVRHTTSGAVRVTAAAPGFSSRKGA
jgi:hypothetical protein